MTRIDAVTLRQLRTLRAVVETGSLTAAAGDLGLSPPAVHGQLRALEDMMAAPLVIRGEHGAFLPTDEGRAVLEAEAQIAANDRPMRADFRSIPILRQACAGLHPDRRAC